MSASKCAACEFCEKGNGIYLCPRCGKKYCSSLCYKSKTHELCSESFYREWVESSLRERNFDDSEKDKMVGILKKFHDAVPEDADDEQSIVDRFSGLNLDDLDEESIWKNLSEEEKNEFKVLIEDEKQLGTIISIKQPWWTVATISLVADMSDETSDMDNVSSRPFYPLNVKKLSSLTSKKPSEFIPFNLVNILYAYAFLNRFYNCDIRDFLEDVVRFFYQFSPVLSEGRNYSTLEESVQDSIRLILNSELSVSLDFIKSIVNDVNFLLQGPVNARPSNFVLRALSDVELLFLELKALEKKKETSDKSFRSQLLASVKKIEYYLSWSLDFEEEFSELSSDLLLLMAPDIFTDSVSSKPEDITQEIVRKPIIEEIE